MKAKLLIVLAIGVLIAACSKDKYETKPTLRFVSMNGNVFPQPSDLSFKLEVTDKEGDLGYEGENGGGADTIWIQKISLTCPSSATNFLSPYTIPPFTHVKHLKAGVDINFSYVSQSQYPIISGCELQDDSCYLKFWIKDHAGNVSDTISSPTFKLLKS